MYTKEELISKKYGELLKILKKLGGKGVRQKTEKVIEQILQAQKSTKHSSRDLGVDETSNTVDDATTNEKENLSANINRNGNQSRRVTRSNTFTLDEVDKNASINSGKGISVSSVASRSPTFIVEKTSIPSPTEDIGSKDDVLTRSDTFVVKSSDGEANPQQHSKLLDKNCERMDLSCSEVQTAADIQQLENIGSQPSSPLSNNVFSALKNRKTSRRSLRGQLLEYNVSSVGRRMILSELSTKISSPMNRSTIQEKANNIEPGVRINENMTSDEAKTDVVEPDNNKPTSSAISRSTIPISDCVNKSAIPKSDVPVPEKRKHSAIPKSDVPAPGKRNQLSAIPRSDVPVPENKNKTSAIPRIDMSENRNDKTTSIPRYVAFARAAKMPNFARIHENAFKKMEALDEYVERKHTRTKSYKGSPASAVKDKNIKRPSVVESTKKVAEKSKDTQAVTRTPKRTLTTPSETSASQTKILRKTMTPPSKSSALPKLVKENVPPKITPSRTWNKSQLNPDTPGSLHRRKTYVPAIPKPQFGFKKSEDVGKSYERKSRDFQKPFGGRREAFKQMAKKHPKLKGREEIRGSEKQFIKGVRTNRRFELQMAKRGIQI